MGLAASLGLVGLLAPLLAGCASTRMQDLAAYMQARHISYCLYITGAAGPYGNAALWAQGGGELNCPALWTQQRLQMLP